MTIHYSRCQWHDVNAAYSAVPSEIRQPDPSDMLKIGNVTVPARAIACPIKATLPSENSNLIFLNAWLL